MMMDHLPAEIILHVISFLPAADLIRVSRVNKRISELAGDQHLLRCLDLRKAYTCSLEELKAFLRPSKRCQSVHRLDMDGVYWLRPPLDTIARMKNLDALHLRGVPLTMHQLHTLLTAGLPLQELSVDWPKSCCPAEVYQEMEEGLSQLKFLCLTVQVFTYTQVSFLAHCPVPLRLVLFCERMAFDNPHRSRCDIVFTDKPISLLNTADVDWKTIGMQHFKYQDKDSANIVPSSLSQVTEVVSTSVGILTTLHSCPSLKGLQILCHPEQPLDLRGVCEAAPRLERLRIHYTDYSDGEKMRGFHIISRLHHLTHLSLPINILCDTQGTGKTSVMSTAPRKAFCRLLKKPRLGAVSSEEDAEVGSLNLIINNCPLLTMLEIGTGGSLKCDRPRWNESLPIHWQSLKNIKKLERLTHLALCSIPVTNGHFLKEIAVGCPRLEFLSLSDLGPRGKCCYLKDLCDSVTHMACLTHLRVDQHYLAPGTALFTALKGCQKLQRLGVYSTRDMMPVDLAAMEQLVEESPCLIFIAVEGAGTSKAACSKFTRNLKKLSRPALVVLTSMEKQNSQLPFAHTDMVGLKSWLSGSHSCSFYNLDFPFRHYVLQLSDP